MAHSDSRTHARIEKKIKLIDRSRTGRLNSRDCIYRLFSRFDARTAMTWSGWKLRHGAGRLPYLARMMTAILEHSWLIPTAVKRSPRTHTPGWSREIRLADAAGIRRRRLDRLAVSTVSNKIATTEEQCFDFYRGCRHSADTIRAAYHTSLKIFIQACTWSYISLSIGNDNKMFRITMHFSPRLERSRRLKLLFVRTIAIFFLRNAILIRSSIPSRSTCLKRHLNLERKLLSRK